MEPFYRVAVFGLLLFFEYSFGDGRLCASPQYIEFGKKETVSCYLEGVYAVSWYNSTILQNEYPIIHCKRSSKSGSGYLSGEFDLSLNGSLLINNVSLAHDHYFAVEFLHSKSSAAVVINVEVIVMVTPLSRFPVVNLCENVSGLCFRQMKRPHLGCSVENARPQMHLEWTLKTVFGDLNISYHQESEINGNLFTSKAETRDTFKYAPRLAVVACKAHTLPGMLERNEYLVLVQNANDGLFSVEPIPKYVERKSTMELHCAGDAIGSLVWWRTGTSSRRLDLLLYAVLIGNPRQEILFKEFKMKGRGSLVLPQVDIEFEGMYSCISSNGLNDSIISYNTIVYVNPTPNYLAIEGCNHQQYCVLEVEKVGNLTCNVNGVRPQIRLQWMVFNEGDPISFKTQQSLVAEKEDTFDISLTSEYHAMYKPGDRVTVVCKIIGPYAHHFDMARAIELIFLKEQYQQTTNVQTDGSNFSLKTVGVTVAVIVPFLMVAAALVIFAVKRTVTGNKIPQSTQGTDNKEKKYQMLPLSSEDSDSFEDMKSNLITYLGRKHQPFIDTLEKDKNNSSEKLKELLCQTCFMGMEIRGDNDKQESAIKLLNMASKKQIHIKRVIIRDCFSSVDLQNSVIITNSDQHLHSNICFETLNIIFSNVSFKDLKEVVNKLFVFATRCPRLKTLKFTTCILPILFEDRTFLKDLYDKKVAVYWENSIFIPKYVLNLWSGRWENDVDGAELKDDDYLYLSSRISDERSLPAFSKILQSARSFSPKQMVLRQKIFQTMESCFRSHGAEEIDTPLFDVRMTTGESFESDYLRLMYYLNDQGEDSVSLRFDLTIPFVRYIATNKLTSMKRYHIGKVYRRDGSVMKGRQCGEFYQCDFDIAGQYDQMIPDAECIKIACTILDELKVGAFFIRVNHQGILNGFPKFCNISKENIAAISRLENERKSELKVSMHNIGKIAVDEANQLLHYIRVKGGRDQVENLLKDDFFIENSEAKRGLEDLQMLFNFCEILGVANRVQFEMDFTRSLGYYTGLVFEAVLKDQDLTKNDKKFKEKGILANGGRYDNLVEKLTGKTVPCVGFTFNFEQIFTLLELKVDLSNQEVATKATEVLVSSTCSNISEEILKLCGELWDAGVKAEVASKRYQDIMNTGRISIPVLACLSEKEIKDCQVMFVTKSSMKEERVRRNEFVSTIKERLQNPQEGKIKAEEHLLIGRV